MCNSELRPRLNKEKQALWGIGQGIECVLEPGICIVFGFKNDL